MAPIEFTPRRGHDGPTNGGMEAQWLTLKGPLDATTTDPPMQKRNTMAPSKVNDGRKPALSRGSLNVK